MSLCGRSNRLKSTQYFLGVGPNRF